MTLENQPTVSSKGNPHRKIFKIPKKTYALATIASPSVTHPGKHRPEALCDCYYCSNNFPVPER